MADITIKHFTDANHNEIAGFSPEAAIYDENGIRLSAKLKDINPNAIRTQLTEATRQIYERKQESLAAIDAAATASTEALNDIYDYLFPLQPEFAVLLETGNKTAQVNYRIKAIDKSTRELADIVPDSVTIKKSVNSGTPTTILQSGTTTGSVVTDITGSIEEYELTVTKAGKSTVKESKKMYVCAYGASSASAVSDGVFNSLKKVLAKGLKSMPTVTTTDGDYIWIIVPNELSINRVVCSGFDVPMEEAETYEISGADNYNGTYKAYRSSKALSASVWKLMLN